MSQSISPERAAQIRQLFEELSELPEAERTQFLDQACREDQSLRLELTSLVRHADSGESRFNDFAEDVVTPMLEALREVPVALEALLDEAGVVEGERPNLWVGRRVSHFEIKESIGRGGMGEVYRAIDTRLNRNVAIKVLPGVFTSDPERLSRFEREAKVLASLNHSNIGHIYGLEEADGTKALVLELVEGPTLAERIKKGPIPIGEALSIARQIAEALETAHERGVIHRDLKPANVKIRNDGTVKVLDFGLAKVFQTETGGTEAQDPTLTAATRPGIIMGTAAYMSPEQAKGEQVDKRSDIWAFGCVLYEMLTGRRAFEGDSVSEIVAGVVKGEPDWEALPKETSPAVVTFLKRCLEKDPQERIRDIGDVSLALTGAFDLAAGPASEHRLWQRPVAAVILGVLIAVVSGLAVWVSTSSRSAPPSAKPQRFNIALSDSYDLGPGVTLALSPDGQTLVYTAANAGSTQLFLRPIDGFEAVPMAHTEGGRDPFFSPDGQWVGFFSDEAYRKVALAGGPALKLAEFHRPPRGTSWATDETIVFGRAPGLARIPAAGGEPTFILESPKGWLTYPQVLPETGAILFTGHDTEVSLLQILLPETGERKTLLSDAKAGRVLPTGHLVFVRSGSLWAVPFDRKRREVVGNPVRVVEGVQEAYENAQEPATVHYAVADTGTLVYLPRRDVPVSSFETRLVLVDR